MTQRERHSYLYEVLRRGPIGRWYRRHYRFGLAPMGTSVGDVAYLVGACCSFAAIGLALAWWAWPVPVIWWSAAALAVAGATCWIVQGKVD
jgi:hypothetical protein